MSALPNPETLREACAQSAAEYQLFSDASALAQSYCREKRYQHCLYVAQTIIPLAKHYDCPVFELGLAAVLHDVAKNQDPKSLAEKGIPDSLLQGDLYKEYPKVWHAFVGPAVVQEKLGIKDSVILDAIRYHTTGAGDMSTATQLLYVSDFIEPSRNRVNQKDLEALAVQDLPSLVSYVAATAIQNCTKSASAIHPNTLDCYHKYRDQIQGSYWQRQTWP